MTVLFHSIYELHLNVPLIKISFFSAFDFDNSGTAIVFHWSGNRCIEVEFYWIKITLLLFQSGFFFLSNQPLQFMWEAARRRRRFTTKNRNISKIDMTDDGCVHIATAQLWIWHLFKCPPYRYSRTPKAWNASTSSISHAFNDLFANMQPWITFSFLIYRSCTLVKLTSAAKLRQKLQKLLHSLRNLSFRCRPNSEKKMFAFGIFIR